MEEYLDILDENGEKTRQTATYNEAHEKGLRHTAVHTWIVNNKKDILIQKREKNRAFFPSHWDISAAGHVSAGEANLEAAVREIQEELGIKLNPQDFKLICTLRTDSEFNDKGLINKEFNPVYVVNADIGIDDIKMDNGELEGIKFLSLDEFKEWIAGKGEPMVPHEEEYKKLLEYLEGKN